MDGSEIQDKLLSLRNELTRRLEKSREWEKGNYFPNADPDVRAAFYVLIAIVDELHAFATDIDSRWQANVKERTVVLSSDLAKETGRVDELSDELTDASGELKKLREFVTDVDSRLKALEEREGLR